MKTETQDNIQLRDMKSIMSDPKQYELEMFKFKDQILQELNDFAALGLPDEHNFNYQSLLVEMVQEYTKAGYFPQLPLRWFNDNDDLIICFRLGNEISILELDPVDITNIRIYKNDVLSKLHPASVGFRKDISIAWNHHVVAGVTPSNSKDYMM